MKKLVRVCLLFALCASFIACGKTQKYEDTNGRNEKREKTIDSIDTKCKRGYYE